MADTGMPDVHLPITVKFPLCCDDCGQPIQGKYHPRGGRRYGACCLVRHPFSWPVLCDPQPYPWSGSEPKKRKRTSE